MIGYLLPSREIYVPDLKVSFNESGCISPVVLVKIEEGRIMIRCSTRGRPRIQLHPELIRHLRLAVSNQSALPQELAAMGFQRERRQLTS